MDTSNELTIYRKVVLIYEPRAADGYRVKQSTNALDFVPGHRVSRQKAQDAIDAGVTVVVVTK